MAIELGTGYVSIVASAKGLSRSISHELTGPLEDEGRRAGERSGGAFSGAFGSSLKQLAVIAGSAFAALGVGSFLKGTVEAASDLNETVSKSNTIFGENAAEIDAWARTAAKSFGQSRKQALEAAATFGNMFQQLGIGSKDAARMSKQMVELASDFASFHNVDITEVLEAQSAAFRGEYDSVQRFVPTITAATVEQKALAMGLAGSTKELDAQDKALATQALLLEGAGAAMGDFARTSDSMANQQRILSALWDDAKSQLGQALLPAVTAVVRFLVSDGIPAFLGIVDAVGRAVDAVRTGVQTIFSVASGNIEEDTGNTGGINQYFERIGLAAFNASQVVKENWPAVRLELQQTGEKLLELEGFVLRNRDTFLTAGAAVGTFVATVGTINQAQAVFQTFGPLAAAAIRPLLAAGPVGLIAAAIAAVGVAVFVAYKRFEPFREVVDAVGRTIRDVVMSAFEWLRDNVPPIAAAVGAGLGRAFQTVRGVIDTVVGAVQRFITTMSGIFQRVVTALTPLAQWFNDNVVATINAGVELVAAILDRVFQAISFGVSNLVAIATPIIDVLVALFRVFAEQVSTAFEVIRVVISTWVSFTVDLISTFIGIIGPIWTGFYNHLFIVAESVFNTIKTVIETILGIIRGVFQVITGLISGDWSKFWEGIRTIASSLFGGVRDLISNLWDTIKSIFSNAMDTAKNTVINGFNEVVSFVSGIPRRIRDAIGDLGGILFEAGKDIIRGLINGVRSMIGELTSTLGSITRLIPNVKGPPERDAKLLYRSGQLVMEGFQAGISSTVPSLVRQLGGITGLVGSTPFGSGRLALAGAGSAGAGVVVNINQPMNPRTVGEEIGWQLRTGRA